MYKVKIKPVFNHRELFVVLRDGDNQYNLNVEVGEADTFSKFNRELKRGWGRKALVDYFEPYGLEYIHVEGYPRLIEGYFRRRMEGRDLSRITLRFGHLEIPMVGYPSDETPFQMEWFPVEMVD